MMLVLRRLRRDPVTLVAAAILLTLIVVAILAPLITPYDPMEQVRTQRLQPPSGMHLMGTDHVGRDIFSRIIMGTRYSLTVGFVSIGIGLSIGGTLGLIAGFLGGGFDVVISRMIDILMAFPSVLLAVVVLAVLGAGLFNVMIAVGVWSIPMFARLVRGSTMALRQRDFIIAARANGASNTRIMFRHILPNIVNTLLVVCTIRMSTAILSAAGLGFLGLGAPPPIPEWGTLLSEGKAYLRTAPHVVLFPGLAVVMTALVLNLLGDALRDALDPHLKD